MRITACLHYIMVSDLPCPSFPCFWGIPFFSPAGGFPFFFDRFSFQFSRDKHILVFLCWFSLPFSPKTRKGRTGNYVMLQRSGGRLFCRIGSKTIFQPASRLEMLMEGLLGSSGGGGGGSFRKGT